MVSSCPVGLSDGETMIATKVGVVKPTNSIILHNILFVPKSKCNFISVSQSSG